MTQNERELLVFVLGLMCGAGLVYAEMGLLHLWDEWLKSRRG